MCIACDIVQKRSGQMGLAVPSFHYITDRKTFRAQLIVTFFFLFGFCFWFFWLLYCDMLRLFMLLTLILPSQVFVLYHHHFMLDTALPMRVDAPSIPINLYFDPAAPHQLYLNKFSQANSLQTKGILEALWLTDGKILLTNFLTQLHRSFLEWCWVKNLVNNILPSFNHNTSSILFYSHQYT